MPVGIALVGLILAAPQLKLAMVEFAHVGLSKEQASYYSEHFALKLGEDPAFRVTSPNDMGALLGLERQKALLGCSDATTSCMAELAGALGVDAVVTGQLARVGQGFQLSVKVLAPDGSRVLFLHASELLASEEKLLAETSAVAREAAAKLKVALADPAEAQVVVSAPGRPRSRLIPAAVGAAFLLLGAGLTIDSASTYGALDRTLMNGMASAAFPQQVASGRTEQAIGIALGVAGLVAIGAALVWFVAGGAE